MNKRKTGEGFIALFSVVIVSAVVAAAAFSLSLAGYFFRFNALDFENKKRSEELARGCLQIALLQLSTKSFAMGVFPVDEHDCEILSIAQDVPSAGSSTIRVRAVAGGSVTNLEAVSGNSGFALQSLVELPNF